MKKILLFIMGFTGLLSPFLVKAQSFTGVTTTPYDTVYYTVGSTATISDDLTNTTSSPLYLKWHVSATNFPADWQTASAFGLCDIVGCRYNTGDTLLWRTGLGFPGSTFLGGPYNPGVAGTFELSLNLSSVTTTTGTYYVTATVVDTITSYSKKVTFIVSKVPAAVPSVPNTSTDVLLYPNPATNELNVVYGAGDDIKNIAVYNIIGKVMTVYKVSGSSANLNLENLPSGIYFVRLYNGGGNVVVTRKFTKQ